MPTPPRRQRTQEERTRATRARLIEAAIGCLADGGLERATTIAIAKRAGVSRGALQHQFRSATDLMIAVIAAVEGDLVHEFDRVTASSLSRSDRLAALIEAYWNVYKSRPYLAVIEILFSGRTDRDLARRSRRAVAEIKTLGERRWRECFADIGTAPADAAKLRTVVISTLRGMAVRRTYWRSAATERADIALLTELCRRYLGR
ncbi:MAG: TetR/AcrR family transcriptional regulator [Alphaproteobacteria bacterium]|nr:TetR/AcrR family transcriptional regulator [Alphaproteobacteria bacterium]